MTRADLEAWLTERGWTKDKFGHFRRRAEVHPAQNGDEYRYKLGRLAVRREVRCKHNDGSKSWVRLRSGYYKDISITPEGKLKGMKR
jgi:hypothetical protein